MQRPRIMSRIMLALPVLLSGCTGVTGYWVGTCDFADGTYAYTADVEVFVKRASGQSLDGEITVRLWDGLSFTSELEGLKSGNFATMEAVHVVETGSYVFTVEALEEGPDLEGDCSLAVPGGSGALTGKVDLER